MKASLLLVLLAIATLAHAEEASRKVENFRVDGASDRLRRSRLLPQLRIGVRLHQLFWQRLSNTLEAYLSLSWPLEPPAYEEAWIRAEKRRSLAPPLRAGIDSVVDETEAEEIAADLLEGDQP